MSLPASMKKLNPYLSRADELDSKFPLVSYFCRLYVVEALMEARKGTGYDSQCDQVMILLLDKCEQAKSKLASDLEAGQIKMEEFSLGVFANADKADRESPIQPPEASLAGRFYIASLFFDVVSQFFDGMLPPDLEEKRRYAKYRTLQIRNRIPLEKVESQRSEPNIEKVVMESVRPTSQTSSSGFQYAAEDDPKPTRSSPVVIVTNPGVARKKLQQAISAIEFSDFPTAVALCMEAINCLGNPYHYMCVRLLYEVFH